jgi:2',3'-cyclic-nucleotide 2'-phosphodiesterase (5'-nucleotidase family)
MLPYLMVHHLIWKKSTKVATNSFMKAGGDGYVMLINKNKTSMKIILFQRDMVISYIEKIKTLDPQKYITLMNKN